MSTTRFHGLQDPHRGRALPTLNEDTQRVLPTLEEDTRSNLAHRPNSSSSVEDEENYLSLRASASLRSLGVDAFRLSQDEHKIQNHPAVSALRAAAAAASINEDEESDHDGIDAVNFATNIHDDDFGDDDDDVSNRNIFKVECQGVL